MPTCLALPAEAAMSDKSKDRKQMPITLLFYRTRREEENVVAAHDTISHTATQPALHESHLQFGLLGGCDTQKEPNFLLQRSIFHIHITATCIGNANEKGEEKAGKKAHYPFRKKEEKWDY